MASVPHPFLWVESQIWAESFLLVWQAFYLLQWKEQPSKISHKQFSLENPPISCLDFFPISMHLYQTGQLTVNVTENKYKLHKTVLKSD